MLGSLQYFGVMLYYHGKYSFNLRENCDLQYSFVFSKDSEYVILFPIQNGKILTKDT